MAQLTKTDMIQILSESEFVQVELTCDECLSTKEKAYRLNRSTDTINSHMKNIFRKLNINKVTELSKIYFTSILLIITLGIHGLFNTQIRFRTRTDEKEIMYEFQNRLRSRRREIEI